MFQVLEAKKQERRSPTGGVYGGSRTYYAKTRVYVFQDKESVMDNLSNRRTRPSKLYREVVLDKYPELSGRINWSQTAGCACGCSPGFIVQETIRSERGVPCDIFITAKFGGE